MPSGPTLVLPERRREWYFDSMRNRWVTVKEWDDDRSYVIDLAGVLDSSETLSSVTAEDVSGVTVNSISVSGTELTVDVTRAGLLTAEITTSASDVIRVPLEFRSTDRQVRDRYAL